MSMVTAMVAWPNRSDTTFGCTPAFNLRKRGPSVAQIMRPSRRALPLKLPSDPVGMFGLSRPVEDHEVERRVPRLARDTSIFRLHQPMRFERPDGRPLANRGLDWTAPDGATKPSVFGCPG